jgi:rod shape-determining protein MreD
MRWITFILLLYIAAALHSAWFCALGGAEKFPRIDYVAMLAIFYALFAAEDYALMAALCCGILYDLMAPSPIGPHTFSLALVAWVIVRVRLSIFREHVISQAVVTMLAAAAFGLLTQSLWVIMPKLLGIATTGLPFGAAMKAWLINALYTGIVAPGVFWLLFKLNTLLGFSVRGPRSGSR